MIPQSSSFKRLHALIRTLHTLVQGKMKILEKRLPDAHDCTGCTHPRLWVPLECEQGKRTRGCYCSLMYKNHGTHCILLCTHTEKNSASFCIRGSGSSFSFENSLRASCKLHSHLPGTTSPHFISSVRQVLPEVIFSGLPVYCLFPTGEHQLHVETVHQAAPILSTVNAMRQAKT